MNYKTKNILSGLLLMVLGPIMAIASNEIGNDFIGGAIFGMGFSMLMFANIIGSQSSAEVNNG